tara:strand:- start:3506 stop:3649 length:144 start_codon:yes stop_codon:yes gene_type:complete
MDDRYPMQDADRLLAEKRIIKTGGIRGFLYEHNAPAIMIAPILGIDT